MNRNIALALIACSFGCEPAQPTAQRTVTNPVAQTQMSATNQSDEQLRNELADLLVRRSTAQDLMKELDERGLKAGKEGNQEISNASIELYIPTCEKLLDIQSRIDQIDSQLGTNSNTKYTDEEKTAKSKLLTEYIENTEHDLAGTRDNMAEAKSSSYNTKPISEYEQLIKYGELKIKLWKRQLEKLK